MQVTFQKALAVSFFLHALFLFVIIPQKRNVIHVPLTVEMIKIVQPQRKELDVQPEPKRVEQKKPKVKKDKKEKEEVAPPKQEAAPAQMVQKLTLEAAQFPFTYYLAMIKKKISANWDWPSTTGTYKTVVYFKILPSGEAVSVKFDERSRDELFDHAAMRAVTLSSPFSPLPGGYTEDYLGVYFEFSFRD